MKINFSIIIPHYNSVSLLDELLGSIFHIGVSEGFEVIIIDDNSPEECYNAVLELNTRKYNNKLKILRNDSGFSGAGAARNLGLSHATGKWILFADADDLFLPGFYETINKHIDENVDVVYFTPTSVDSEGKKSERANTYLKQFDRYFEFGDEDGLRYSLAVIWSRLYRREFVQKNQIFFETIQVSNDVMFALKVGIKANEIKIVKDTIYAWRFTIGSLTTKVNKEAFDQRMKTAMNANAYLKENLDRESFLKNRPTLPKYVALSLLRNKMGVAYTYKLAIHLLRAKFGIAKLADFKSITNFFTNNKLYKKKDI